MTLATPLSKAMICWVRRAISTAFSEGRARASSIELVCRLWQPPRTPARASRAVRTMLISGCWAVRLQPAVWTWKRQSQERGFFAL